MKEKLEQIFIEILEKIGVADPKVLLEHPENLSFGDYTTNVALIYSKDLKEKPFILAQKIVALLEAKQIPSIEKFSIAGPGFINIFLDRNFFSESVKNILAEGQKYGDNESEKNKKVIIEYTNTNVLKPFHIGHLMGNIIGESLSRLYEIASADLKRNTYQGDVGLHIAKALWGIKSMYADMPAETAGLSIKIDFIGKAYAHGAKAYEDNSQATEEIKQINRAVFEKSDKQLLDLYDWGRKISLEHFEDLYKKLGTKFDYYFFEGEVANDAVKIVKEFVKKGVFEESEGAVVFRGESRDPKLHTRVFINSQGLPTYEAKDIAHAIRKYKTFPFDQSIIITANEQDDYFRVVLKALQEIDPAIASKTKHLSHGMLRLSSGKISSRKGNGITGESLIEDIEEMVSEKIRERDFNEAEMRDIIEKVAIGAIKYSILKQAPGSNIIFDLEKSISFEGDSGPYLQYTSVRAGSVLTKAEAIEKKIKVGIVPEEISDLEKQLYRFPEAVARARQEYSPHYLALYLTQLASAFNSWYGNTKIIDEKDPYSPYKLALTQATKIVLDKGLFLLGILVPVKM